MRKVIVVGGGAAGMMAACSAAENGADVTILDKNEKLGKKVYITGKGRCNVTNSVDTSEFFGNVIHNPKFLYSSIYGFDHNSVFEFVEKWGCPLKTERGERVFPVSDHSSDVIGAFKRALNSLNVKTELETEVLDILTLNDKAVGIIIKDKAGKKEKRLCDSLILATGGLSYPVTGSSGELFDILSSKGIDIIDMKPALVPLISGDEACREMQGLSLRNVKVSLLVNDKKIYEDFGEMLFTHQGVSGPLILSASSYYSDYAGKLEKKGVNDIKANILIDLKPALDMDTLDKRVLRDFSENINRQFKNSLDSLFPGKLIPVMVRKSGIRGEKPVHEITKSERENFVRLIKNFEINISGTAGFNEAIITQGGINVKEINASTMELKKFRNVFVAGEMIDVDALTGGFNLQIAWSTGYLAGENAAKETEND